MTQESHGKITVRSAIVVLIVLVGLLQLSFWADRKGIEVEGPSRIVRGPQDTIYIQIDRKIAKVSSGGEVLHVLDLDADAGIPEHIADFFVEDDGTLLIARRDSQLLQYYSSEGKLIKTHARIPSALVEGNHFWKFSKDPATGVLYIADTSHHRIQLFGPDEKEIKTIRVPSGVQIAQTGSEHEEYSEEGEAYEGMTHSPNQPLHYPNGLIFDRDRLIATDTGNSRIILFYPDGTLDKIILVLQGESSSFTNPLKVGRFGDNIYAIVRGPNFLEGKVQAFEFNTGLLKTFRYSRSIDPWDLFARPDDVLVADRTSLTVLRYTPVGRFLGTFGKPSLLALYAESQLIRKTYEWVRKVSLAGMLLVPAWLLFAARRQRISHEQAGIALYSPVTGLQSLLGPLGRIRRNILLFLIPGLGQAAAGRILRASAFFIILLCFASLAIYSWFQYQAQPATSLPVMITFAMMAYTVWIVIVLDGIRLSGRPSDNTRQISSKQFLLAALSAPLITICSAAAAQLTREFLAHSNPDISLAIQKIFHSLMTGINGYTSSFAAIMPASVILGWGGAGAGMFGTLAWQAGSGRNKAFIGIIIGFLAGIFSWLISVLIGGNRLGWTLYIHSIHAGVLSLFVYLYFRSMGMPVLVIPVAVAGAWVGDFLRLFLGVLNPIRNILVSTRADAIWTGTIARLELIVVSAFFIHLAIWAAWNTASDRPVAAPRSES